VQRGGLDNSDRLLSSLPLFWVAGLVIRALPTLASGCALALLETFTVDAAVAALRRTQPTALHLRPPQVGQILAHPDFDPALLERVCKGGGRSEWFAPYLRQARLITGYGMTEMSGYVTALDWQDPAEIRNTQIGRPLPGVELRIAATDAPDIGEVLVRGPGLFRGYYKEAPGTGMDNGWFQTGDLGRIDAGGAFHFAGRSKDLLRVKGINVSPVEVESVLASHPDVEAAFVVGLPASALDQQIVALIVWKTANPDNAALRALCEGRLSSYKRPAHYLPIARRDVPLGSTSKPQRAELAALATRRLPRNT
jgi:fatty-acyl-CoA synthase